VAVRFADRHAAFVADRFYALTGTVIDAAGWRSGPDG
jgi:hypothetical protein